MTKFVAVNVIETGHPQITNALGQVVEASTLRTLKPGDEVTGLPEAELQRLLKLGAIRDASIPLPQPPDPKAATLRETVDKFGMQHPVDGHYWLGSAVGGGENTAPALGGEVSSRAA